MALMTNSVSVISCSAANLSAASLSVLLTSIFILGIVISKSAQGQSLCCPSWGDVTRRFVGQSVDGGGIRTHIQGLVRVRPPRFALRFPVSGTPSILQWWGVPPHVLTLHPGRRLGSWTVASYTEQPISAGFRPPGNRWRRCPPDGRASYYDFHAHRKSADGLESGHGPYLRFPHPLIRSLSGKVSNRPGGSSGGCCHSFTIPGFPDCFLLALLWHGLRGCAALYRHYVGPGSRLTPASLQASPAPITVQIGWRPRPLLPRSSPGVPPQGNRPRCASFVGRQLASRRFTASDTGNILHLHSLVK